MPSLLTCAALAATGASGVHAQTVPEAAAANMQLAMSLCLQNYHDPQSLPALFRQAGFAETTEDMGGRVIHWMTDPAGTVQVNLQPGPDVGAGTVCDVSTDHMGVTQALPFAGGVMQQALGTAPDAGSPEGVNLVPGAPGADGQPCSGWSALVPRVAIWVQVGTAGQDPVCVENGTANVMIRM